jgi:hypothetical protein
MVDAEVGKDAASERPEHIDIGGRIATAALLG